MAVKSTTSTANVKQQQTGGNATGYQVQQAAVHQLLTSSGNFPTLSKVSSAEWIVLAIMKRESSFNPYARSHSITTPENSSLVREYVTSAQVAPLYKFGAPSYDLVRQGFFAWGVAQVMGWQHIDWSTPDGRTGDLKGHPLAARYGLVLPAGSDIQAKLYTGNNALTNGLISAMIILEKRVKIWMSKSGQTIDSAMRWAVGSYLGNGADANGITTSQYIYDVYENARQLSGGTIPTVASNSTPPLPALAPPIGCS